MAIMVTTVNAKTKIKIFCDNKYKFMELNNHLTLYLSLHGRLEDETYLNEWNKTSAMNNDYLVAPKFTSVFFYNYGNSAIDLKYDNEVIDEVTLDFNIGCD